MTDERDRTPAEAEQEIRQSRRFTVEEAMARMAGPGAMKGASPVSEVQQAGNAIGTWLRDQVADPTGALQAVMHRHIKASRLLLDSIERPLEAITGYARRVLGSEELLSELVREADVEWGRMMDERPHFERDGAPPHPDDPYTRESVRAVLRGMVATLDSASPG